MGMKFKDLIGLLLCFIPIVILSMTVEYGKDRYYEYKENKELYDYVKEVVEENLVSPSSAKFCPFKELRIQDDYPNYVVRGYVDSQNSFGAMIRSDFVVTMKKGMYNGKYCYGDGMCYLE